MAAKEESMILSVLALRGLVAFPQMSLSFDVTRESSIRALERATADNSQILLVPQRDLAVEEPSESDLYSVGVICHIRQILRVSGGNVRVMVEGLDRGAIQGMIETSPFFIAKVTRLDAPPVNNWSPRNEAAIRVVYNLFERYLELTRMSFDLMLGILSSDDPGYIADYIAQNISARVEEKQAVLEAVRPGTRLARVAQILRREIQVLELEESIEKQTRLRVAGAQRDFVLREQMKAIRAELGEDQDYDGDDELDEYRRRVLALTAPDDVKEKLNKEISRLEKQPMGSAEGAALRGYLDVVLDLPWGKRTRDRADVAQARKYLERDHYGLEKVKERILEFLAVKQLAPELRGQILCLVGPPGVGKTSIALSVAKATRRKLARVSLGGVHDEAEIRGHRKTYIGSMPGRIMTAIQQAGSCNPLMVLDEVDKLGSDYRGDPSSALLEVLDPEQNTAFRDHYLELPFDLSDVMFITTANTLETIPRPLLDRMEVIELSSYTDEEKLQISKRYLLPKQMTRHGLKKSQMKLSDTVLRAVIAGYTKESGVRALERTLAAICRKAAMRLVEEGVKSFTVTEQELEQLLGPRKYRPERTDHSPKVGVVNGLAWTSVGGELLQVEVNIVPGSGKLQLTGNLGDVMRESCKAAISYIRSQVRELEVPEDFYKTKDIHVHFPAGAVPKDGPSAGVAITTALVSALTGRPVRGDVAMTGEVSLRGRVLPIGGLREKTMGALREGIRTVILPEENLPDLEEIDQAVRAQLRFLPAARVESVLESALLSTEEAQGEEKTSAPEFVSVAPAARLPLGQ